MVDEALVMSAPLSPESEKLFIAIMLVTGIKSSEGCFNTNGIYMVCTWLEAALGIDRLESAQYCVEFGNWLHEKDPLTSKVAQLCNDIPTGDQHETTCIEGS